MRRLALLLTVAMAASVICTLGTGKQITAGSQPPPPTLPPATGGPKQQNEIKEVTSKDQDGQTVYEYIDQTTGKKVRDKTILNMPEFDAESRLKRMRAVWKEQDYDAAGEVKEERNYNGLHKLAYKTEMLGKGSRRTTSYYESGKRSLLYEWEQGKPAVFTAYKQDGATIWYVFTNQDGNKDAHGEVFFDWDGKATNRRFTRKEVGGPKPMQRGKAPEPFYEDTYTDAAGTPLYRQTWYWVWRDNQIEWLPVHDLGQVVVFAADGKTIAQRLRFTPNGPRHPLLRDVEIYHNDGSRTVRTYDICGLPEKEEVIMPDGSHKAGRKLTAKDSDILTMPSQWREGFKLYLGAMSEKGVP